MWSKKEIIIFIAGAQTFHTISHLFLNLVHALPMNIFFITLTTELNIIMIAVNALITIGLFWWINKLK